MSAEISSADERRAFTRIEGTAFAAAMVAVQLSSELFAQWGTYFYSPSEGVGRIVYVPVALVSVIFITGRLFDIITDPLIGRWSDRTRPRRSRFLPCGRRRPFIFAGSILMTLTGTIFWFPPVAAESALNLVFGTFLMSAHWIVFTLAYIPLLALAPEVARTTGERVRLGGWIAAGLTLGLAAAVVLPGILIERLDPARASGTADGVAGFSPAGYQRVAVIFSLASLALFQFFVFVVREPETGAARDADPATPPPGRILSALRIPDFRRYLFIFGFMYLGVLAFQRVVPYWVELGLHGDEGTVTLLGVPFILACLAAVAVCPALTRRFGVRRVMIAAVGMTVPALPAMHLISIVDLSDQVRTTGGMVINTLLGSGQGLIYVLMTPLIGGMIDEDARRNGGVRREGVFNALHAVMVKCAQVAAIGLSTGSMALWGKSAERPEGVFAVGSLAGLCCLASLIFCFGYPGPASSADAAGAETERE